MGPSPIDRTRSLNPQIALFQYQIITCALFGDFQNRNGHLKRQNQIVVRFFLTKMSEIVKSTFCLPFLSSYERCKVPYTHVRDFVIDKSTIGGESNEPIPKTLIGRLGVVIVGTNPRTIINVKELVHEIYLLCIYMKYICFAYT